MGCMWASSFPECMEKEKKSEAAAAEEAEAERLCQIVLQRDKVSKMALSNLNDKLSVLEQQMEFLETHLTAVTYGEEATRSQ